MESENKLYRKTYHRKVKLKDGSELNYHNYGYYISYGKIEDNSQIITEWDELLRALNYVDEYKGNTNRKGRVYCYVEFYDHKNRWSQARLYKDEFEKVEIYYKYHIFEQKDVRMGDLVKELNADEFILFLKDNEVNYIPNIK